MVVGFLDSLGVHPALILLFVFALAVTLYGGVLRQTGDKDWLPMRTWPTVGGPEDVRHVGRCLMIVGAVILGIVCLGIVVNLAVAS